MLDDNFDNAFMAPTNITTTPAIPNIPVANWVVSNFANAFIAKDMIPTETANAISVTAIFAAPKPFMFILLKAFIATNIPPNDKPSAISPLPMSCQDMVSNTFNDIANIPKATATIIRLLYLT